MKFLVVLFLLPLVCQAEVFTYERNEKLYATPTFELGPRSQTYGASVGILTKSESTKQDKSPFLHGYTAAGPVMRFLGIAHDDKIEGGMFFGAFNTGSHGWEWIPMNIELGVGSAMGQDSSGIAIFEVGVFVGTAVTLQVGVISYVPLSTSDKPEWFPDWTIAVRYPIGITELSSSKITVDHTQKL